MQQKACAKLNLGLNVVSKRTDGYHDIETVFVRVRDLFDTLNLEQRADKNIVLTDVAGACVCKSEDNLIYKTARYMCDEFGLCGVNVEYEKRIPTGAGLGGGSSDAASTAVAINELYHLNLSKTELKDIVSRFGSDCAFFIEDTPCYATGKGEILEPYPLSLEGWHLVIAKPQVSVSTAQAYSRIAPKQPKENIRDILKAGVDTWRGRLGNDFEESVFPLFPVIEQTKQTLYDLGASFALMTGSGASVFALFKRLPENLNSELLKIDNEMFVFCD